MSTDDPEIQQSVQGIMAAVSTMTALKQSDRLTVVDVRPLTAAATAAREAFESRPDRESSYTRELSGLARSLEGITLAAEPLIEDNSPDSRPVAEAYAVIAGQLVQWLAMRTGVVIDASAPADGDDVPPGPRH